jgi:hypothetical protein
MVSEEAALMEGEVLSALARCICAVPQAWSTYRINICQGKEVGQHMEMLIHVRLLAMIDDKQVVRAPTVAI